MTRQHSVTIGFLSAAVACCAALGQPTDPVPGEACGTRLTLEDVAIVLAHEWAGLYEGPAVRGAEWWYIPITMHVVRRSNGSGGLPESRLSTALDDVNGAFAPPGMVFYRSGPTRYIDSDDFYFNIDTYEEINALRQTDVVAGTMNVYFTENLAFELGDICGISSFTTTTVQGIVVENSCTAVSDNHSTFPHEVGHYFDLYHTHETMFGAECANGSNCAFAGDLVCDTPADPVLSEDIVDSSCVYTGTETDGCTGAHYFPQTWNLMSFSPAVCRNAFSGQQDARSRATLENLRPELAGMSGECAAATFVNRDFPDGGTGTAFFPFDAIGEAVQAAPDGACLIIGAGAYPEAPITLSRSVTLYAPLSAALIGQ